MFRMIASKVLTANNCSNEAVSPEQPLTSGLLPGVSFNPSRAMSTGEL